MVAKWIIRYKPAVKYARPILNSGDFPVIDFVVQVQRPTGSPTFVGQVNEVRVLSPA